MVPAADGRARDRDHDGLSTFYELTRSHTDPGRRDTDGDRLLDYAEVKRYHTNPRRRDTDGDKLLDYAEVKRYHTNPRRRDTDGDKLLDYAEVKRYHTNPRRRDTDGDKLSDYAEVKRYHTDPRRRDTDGDGVPDGVEVVTGRDPQAKGPSKPASVPVPTRTPTPTPTPTPVPGPTPRPVRSCTTTVTSVAALQSAVSAAAPGAVVCLADGSYASLGLSAAKSAEVVAQAQNAGRATITGANLGGSNVTLTGFNVVGQGVRIQAGSDHITVEYNRIAGGGQGVDFVTDDSPTINDTVVRGNQFVGPFEEDAIHLNGYHDGPDADPYGVLIEGNEITNVREDGQHNDCLQSVWVGTGLYFVRNYLHDNACQGFFVKDQASAIDKVVAHDNLIIRNAAGCIPASRCPNFTLSPFQVYGPISSFQMTRNTIWTPEQEPQTTLRGSGWGRVEVDDNVIYRAWSDTSGPFGNYGASNNLACQRQASWPSTGITINCSPPFPNVAAGDYRLPGRGVDWAVADQHYGP